MDTNKKAKNGGPIPIADPTINLNEDTGNQLLSQNRAIKAYLLSGGSLTALDGLRLFNSWSLSQRIFDLRTAGIPIQTEMILLSSGKRVAKYRLKQLEYATIN